MYMVKSDRWDAEHYKKHSDTQFHGALDILNDYSFQGHEHILDIGCGDGKLTALIAQRLSQGEVVGIDASQNMIDNACKSYKDIKNVIFKCVPAENFVTNQTFDLIVSFFAFHWIADQEKVFRNIFHMLKPGGTLIIKTSGGNSRVIEEVFDRDEWKRQFVEANTWHGDKSSDDYKRILGALGFKSVNITVTQASRLFESEEAFVGYAMAWLPHVTGMSNEKSLELAHDLAQRARETMKIKDPQGRIELVSPIATIWAQR
jgi:trans-aconitate methyltransferase